MLAKVYVLESVDREVVNSAYRVLSPTVNHLHKVLRKMERELFSVEREVVNPAHRVLSPTVNHMNKVLRDEDGERTKD